MNTKIKTSIIFLVLISMHTSNVFACPNIQEFVDYNCDKKIKVAFTGDSITYGRGDYIHGDQGGFVLRLETQYPEENINFKNVGVPGYTSTALLRAFKQNLNKKEEGKTKRRVRDADAIIIKVGVNDWWIKDTTPTRVVTTIKRLISFLRKKVPQLSSRKDILGINKPAPFIAVSTLIPAKRPSQMAFVNALNAELIKYNSKALPVLIHSEGFDPNLIDESTVHPNPKGYNWLAKVMKKFLTKGMKNYIKKNKLLPDKDKDGVYDFFEKNLFHTSIQKTDTDNDGFSDKEEIFYIESDPLDPNDPEVVLE